MTDQLNFFIPAQEVSPIQLIKLQGKKRKRATSPNKKLTKDLAETLTADNSQRKDDQKW
jgi:putative transcriptional regulator